MHKCKQWHQYLPSLVLCIPRSSMRFEHDTRPVSHAKKNDECGRLGLLDSGGHNQKLIYLTTIFWNTLFRIFINFCVAVGFFFVPARARAQRAGCVWTRQLKQLFYLLQNFNQLYVHHLGYFRLRYHDLFNFLKSNRFEAYHLHYGKMRLCNQYGRS
jgi:hypothetical protein